MRRVIFNQKGGVGKSTITCNLAAISAQQGKRTLVVDLDVQGNSTQYLLGHKIADSDKTIAHFFKDSLSISLFGSSNTGSGLENAIHEMFLVMENMKAMTQTMNPNSMMELEKHFSNAFDMIKNHKDEFLFSLIKQNLMKGIEEGCYRKDLDIDIISKFRLETVFIPFNLHLFPLSKFNSLEVHTQLMEHFVYGLMTIKGHELMDRYKQLSKQAI